MEESKRFKRIEAEKSLEEMTMEEKLDLFLKKVINMENSMADYDALAFAHEENECEPESLANLTCFGEFSSNPIFSNSKNAMQ